MSDEMLAQEDEYFDLLLNFCLKIDRILFISCDRACAAAAERIAKKATKMGIEEVHVQWQDARVEAEILRRIACRDIASHPAFDLSVWNGYAERGAAFLILKTEIPGAFEGIDEAKVVEAAKVKRNSQKIYKKKQLSYEVSWTIAILPNEIWAERLYPEAHGADAYKKFYAAIFQACMVGCGGAAGRWKEQLRRNSELAHRLNGMRIKSLHYIGENGTDLRVRLSPKAVWMGADKGGIVVNMPTYEVYTFPDANGIDGVVYSTRPLYYNGVCIGGFVVEFKGGKAVHVQAESGEDALRCLIGCTDGSNSLGEVALVDCRSPVAALKKNFGITLLDENAACHFAFGNAYPATFCGYENAGPEELAEEGFNVSSVHVDFMVGYEGLTVTAETQSGEAVLMKDGKIVL